MTIEERLSAEFGVKPQHTANIINLIDEGCTIPFIARYRKELTGSCDDQILREFNDRLNYLRNLDKRKEEVTKSITEQEKMTDEISKAIEAAETLTEVEDIYRPFKPKRKTRASVAIARGLSPLADAIYTGKFDGELEDFAQNFVDPEKEVNNKKEAIAGALDIIAENASDSAEIRKVLRELLFRIGKLETALVESENSKTYEMYKEYSENVNKMPSHRILAINRGENEGCLKVKLVIDSAKAISTIEDMFLNKGIKTEELVKGAIADSFERLIFPSIEREIRTMLTDTANEQAIKMFEVNLKPLLLQPPLKDKVIMGFDPAYRTGCKIAVIDGSGNVLTTTVIYPTPPQSKVAEATEKMIEMIDKYKIDVISIGNGTASKESEIFVAELIKKTGKKVNYAMTNEAGASVYSASKLGAEEFPDFDVALRSAVSIARRLQDPLAELIKIDVKSIGVGQYQHDMPQKRLTEVLDGVVEDCVNSVGVDLNTASVSLLSFVSGMNQSIAKNVVDFRQKNGTFDNREQLRKVNKLGDKAYEQCAGFLRIVGGKNILDNTAVHPESYTPAKKLMELFNIDEDAIKNGEIATLPSKVKLMGEEEVAKKCGIGVPTLNDIVNELIKPGRDIRESLPPVELRSDILDIKDLKESMILTGTVRNVIDFGAFVDIGVHQDGLIHISQISDGYVKHPSDELKVGQVLKVKVLSVDLDKNRIALTLKGFDK
ncbi:MAG: RNA-binding transcriptional accessory protein [Christensenellaceae bacterium]|jgi:uncharacterized protein|nr:RNA-binding transcriptional accessory protein [Christensenellaceae bacterium]